MTSDILAHGMEIVRAERPEGCAVHRACFVIQFLMRAEARQRGENRLAIYLDVRCDVAHRRDGGFDDEGDVLDSSQGAEPLTYIHGAGNIITGLENALEGKAAGETLKVIVQPAQGYGARDEELVPISGRPWIMGVGFGSRGSGVLARVPLAAALATVYTPQCDAVCATRAMPAA